VRRPNSKRNAFGAAYLRNVRAELVVDLFVASFAKEMEVNLAESWRKLLRFGSPFGHRG
jgi:hypothetical protein